MAKLTHQRLAEGRISQGLTKAALSRAIGCHWSMVAHVEAGRRTPGLALAARIEVVTAAWPSGVIRATDWVHAQAAA